jgi:hypothetical protein
LLAQRFVHQQFAVAIEDVEGDEGGRIFADD